jgi:hypothetical protein
MVDAIRYQYSLSVAPPIDFAIYRFGKDRKRAFTVIR